MKPNIKDLTLRELENRLIELNQPPYRARQIWQWLFQKRATGFAEMANLSAALRRRLEEEFSIGRLQILHRAESRDGTVKFLFSLDDGEAIESVLIPEAKRLTLCISTQAGCGFGCAFCATALLGLKRNLRQSEIVDQVLEVSRTLRPRPSAFVQGGRAPKQESRERHSEPQAKNLRAPATREAEILRLAPQDDILLKPQGQRKEIPRRPERVTHVVLMGMGEPLANYRETLGALRIMTDTSWGIGLSLRRITLSTVGLVPQIQKLMEETRVNLAVSLHAANDELRARLMPVNRKYSLQQLMECCRVLPIPRRKRITFEYVLLSGVNDSPEDARQLCQLLQGIPCKVNVIPFNPHPGSPFERPAEREIARFQQLLQQHGVQVNVRRPRGDDIRAACGQLQGEVAREQREKELLAAEAR